MPHNPHARRPLALLEQFPLLGRAHHLCPVCNRQVRAFLPAGDPLRSDAQCPRCHALERDRLAWLFIIRNTGFLEVQPKRRMLHVGATAALSQRFAEAIGMGYTAIAPMNPSVAPPQITLEITQPDNTFDILYCDQTFENTADDLQAMRELHRVLKPGGWAVLLAPITAPSTFDASRDMPPEERARLFGRESLMRRYGPDYAQRLRDTGFNVQVFAAHDFAGHHEIRHMALTASSGLVHYCTK